MPGFTKIVAVLIALVAAFLTFYGIMLVLNTGKNSTEYLAWRWAFLLAGWFPVVLFHELGHAIAAHLAGWRVLVFHVAPWAIRLRPFRLFFAGYLGGPDIGGFVAAVPGTSVARTKLRETIFTAGGPIASWFLAFALLAISTVPWASIVADSFPRALCAALGLYSCAGALMATWPQFQNGRGLNDAGMIANLWREHAPTSGLTYAYSLVSYGAPRSTWDPWITESLVRAKTEANSNATMAYFLDFLACMLERRDKEAGEIAHSLSTLSPDAAATRIIQALVAALIDNHPRQAEDHLARIRSLDHAWPPVLRLRQVAIAAVVAHEDGRAAIKRIDHSTRTNSEGPDFPGGAWSALNARVTAVARRQFLSAPHDVQL